ncbi:hypothetical protein EE612_032388, partial [Oryza sativa]
RGCGRRWCSWCGGRTPWRGRSAGRGSAGRRTGSSSAATPRRTRCARRRARPALPRHRPARAAALPRVDVALRQGVRLVERRHTRALRRRLSHGEADPVRPDGAVRQTGARAELSGVDRQRPRLRQRRRLGAAPPRRAPGVRHGQAQDDGQDDGGVRAGGDPGVGGACRRRRAAGAGGGRAEVPGADRRRDLAYGVRQQLQGREGGVRRAARAPVHRLLHHIQHPLPGQRVHRDEDEPAPATSRQEGERHAQAIIRERARPPPPPRRTADMATTSSAGCWRPTRRSAAAAARRAY